MTNRFNITVILLVAFSAFCTITTSCGNKTESSSKTEEDSVAGYEASLIDFGTDGYSFIRKNGTEAKIPSGAKVILKKIYKDNVVVSAESADGDMVEGEIDASRISWREDAMDLFLPYYIKGYRSAEEVFQDINLSNQRINQEHIYKLLVSFKELWPEWENYKNQEADSLPENIVKILDDILYNGSFYDQESQTAIHFFAENAGADFMKRFVLSSYNYSSNVNFKDQNGRTPLMAAVLAGNASAMQMLLMNGADMEIKDYSGKSAGDYVRESSSREVKAVAEASLTTPEDFSSLISMLKEKQVAECLNNGIYFKIPLSLWQRYEKTDQKISVKSDIREFFTELSLLEALNDGQEVQNEENQAEQSQNELDQNDGHKQTAYTFNDEIKSPVMNDCTSNSQVVFELGNGTEVQILERSEEPDTLNDVTDWWYKIKSGEQEGWCFGGNLFYPYYPEDVESLEKERDILKQQDFEKNKIYKVFCNGEIICKDGKKVPVETGNNITVLSVVEDCMDYSSSTLGKCKYYIVQGPEYAVGILSGACIAHKEDSLTVDDGGKTKWFFSLYSDSGEDCYADVSMIGAGKNMHVRFARNPRIIGENVLVGFPAKLKVSGADDYNEEPSIPDVIHVDDWRKIETPPEWNQELGKAVDYYILVINSHAKERTDFYSSDDRSVNYFSAWCMNENGWASEIVSERAVKWSVSENFKSYGMRVEEFPAGDEKLNNTIREFVVSTYDYGIVKDDWDGLPVEYTVKESYRYDRTVPCSYEFNDTDHWDYIPEW